MEKLEYRVKKETPNIIWIPFAVFSILSISYIAYHFFYKPLCDFCCYI